MSFNTLSAIIRRPWAIDRNWAESNLPLVATMLKGGQATFKKQDSIAYSTENNNLFDAPKPIIVLMSPGAGAVSAVRYNSFKDVPEGSIALIPIIGPIMKYEGDCGEPGTIQMDQWVQEAKASSKIVGAIFKFDTPGGMVDGTATLADSIKNFGKPTIGFIDDGMMASAGMWLGSACDEIYASQPTDTAGSIGVLTAFFDFIEFWKKEGINYHEIYAPQSTDKNGDYRAAVNDGNYDPIKADLKFLADQLINTIKTNRKGKLNLEFDNPFTGKMFYAKDAISVGLIDGIASMAEVMNKIQDRITNTSNTNNTQLNHTTMFGKNPFAKLSALKSKKAGEISTEEISGVNEEISAEGVGHVELVKSADLELLITANTDLENQLTVATKKLNDLNAEYTAFKNDRAASATNTPKAGSDEIPGGDDEDTKFLTDVDIQARAMKAKQSKK